MIKKNLLVISLISVFVISGLVAYAVNTLTITGGVVGNVVVINEPEILIDDSGIHQVSDLDLYVDGVLVDSFTFDPVVGVTTGVPTILDHTFGVVIDDLTSFYVNATVAKLIDDYNVTGGGDSENSFGWDHAIYQDEFISAFQNAGDVINNVGLKVNLLGTQEAYKTDDHSSDNDPNKDGYIFFNPYNTGSLSMRAGSIIDRVGFNVVAGSGNVRVSIYNANGSAGSPLNLLGQSSSTAISGTGVKNVTVSVTIPFNTADLVPIWVAFETDDSSLELLEQYGFGLGTSYALLHTYGSAPNPIVYEDLIPNTEIFWTELTYHGSTPHVRVSVYDDTGGGGGAGNLLGQSASTIISETGIVLIPVTATVPNNGNVWVGFETDSSLLDLYFNSNAQESSGFKLHTYGSAPNPFGEMTPYTVHFWKLLTVSSDEIESTFEVQSNTLFFSPDYTPTYISNCGIAGCASKLVNYTFYRFDDFRQLNLKVNVIPIPFDIECLMTNGTFLQSSAWHNFSQIQSLNLTVNVPPNDNVYGICYGSPPLLSFSSSGNQTLMVTGSNVLSGSYGAMIGVPIGTFVIVMFAALASQRTAPIFVVIVLALIGIMSTLSFFTLSAGIWAMVLIAGMLGLFVGRKVF